MTSFERRKQYDHLFMVSNILSWSEITERLDSRDVSNNIVALGAILDKIRRRRLDLPEDLMIYIPRLIVFVAFFESHAVSRSCELEEIRTTASMMILFKLAFNSEMACQAIADRGVAPYLRHMLLQDHNNEWYGLATSLIVYLSESDASIRDNLISNGILESCCAAIESDSMDPDKHALVADAIGALFFHGPVSTDDQRRRITDLLIVCLFRSEPHALPLICNALFSVFRTLPEPIPWRDHESFCADLYRMAKAPDIPAYDDVTRLIVSILGGSVENVNAVASTAFLFDLLSRKPWECSPACRPEISNDERDARRAAKAQ